MGSRHLGCPPTVRISCLYVRRRISTIVSCPLINSPPPVHSTFNRITRKKKKSSTNCLGECKARNRKRRTMQQADFARHFSTKINFPQNVNVVEGRSSKKFLWVYKSKWRHNANVSTRPALKEGRQVPHPRLLFLGSFLRRFSRKHFNLAQWPLREIHLSSQW